MHQQPPRPPGDGYDKSRAAQYNDATKGVNLLCNTLTFSHSGEETGQGPCSHSGYPCPSRLQGALTTPDHGKSNHGLTCVSSFPSVSALRCLGPNSGLLPTSEQPASTSTTVPTMRSGCGAEPDGCVQGWKLMTAWRLCGVLHTWVPQLVSGHERVWWHLSLHHFPPLRPPHPTHHNNTGPPAQQDHGDLGVP